MQLAGAHHCCARYCYIHCWIADVFYHGRAAYLPVLRYYIPGSDDILRGTARRVSHRSGDYRY